MKIAFIGQKGIPAKLGGVERHVEELAIRLAQKGHEVFVYVRNNYTDRNLNNYKGVKLVHLPSISTKHLDAISHTFFATIHALFQKYDVVHYQAIGPSFLSWIIKVFKRKTVVVATFHCQDYYHKKWNWFARMSLRLGEYVACQVPDKTIVVSNALSSYVKNTYGKEAAFIPNGFTASPTDETSGIEKWGLEKNRYFLAVSRLIKHKGIHYLIEAFKNLEDKNLIGEKKLVIVGDGFYTDEYVEHLKKISEGRKNIIFTGTQSGSTLSQLFSHAYFFVQPSDSEGLSITLLEAMGYGKAVLVSDIPENMEAVAEAGVSFKHGDASDLEKRLIELSGDQEKIDELGRIGKIRAEDVYDWDKISERTEELYSSVLNKKRDRK